MTPILSSTILRTQSDARLLALATNGHTRAFEAIVERYRRPLLRWCRTILPEARAEDAVQTAFLKAWSALGSGTTVDDLKPWLYRIARNAALDNARKAGYDYEELSEALRLAPAPESELERRSVMRETLTGVAGLPENQREALLRTAAGHSRADIARELHVTEGAVRQLVHRARATLRGAATALTPVPLVNWAAAFGAEAGTPAGLRIAELAAGASGAGLGASAVKAGTIVAAAGVLAAGPGTELRDEVSPGGAPAAAAAQASDSPSRGGRGDAHRGRAGDDAGRGGDDDRSSRGPGGGDDDRSGPSGGDDDRSGPGDGSLTDSSGSGSSGSGSSGGDTLTDSSGSGSSGSGSSGSGSTGSGSSGSGSSGSGSSGSGSTGSGSSGSGSSGSGSSGDGSLIDSSGSGSSGSGSLTDSSGSSSYGSGSSGSGSLTDSSESGSSGSGSLDD